MIRYGFLLLFVCGQLLAHPAHVSIAEVEWNQATGSFEVSLKTDPEGLELALSGLVGERLALLGDGSLDGPLRRLMSARFSLVPQEGDPLRLHWLGYTISHQAVWLYFEFHAGEGQSRFKMANQLLLEKRARQVNTVILKVGDQQQTFRFHRDAREAILDLQAPVKQP